jgi:TolB-like protein/Tfp pilus assembly protein PilF
VTASYKFGRFELRLATRQLLIDDQPAPLGARAFDVLRALIERRERLVTKEELLELAWPGLVVEENNLQVQVSALRKVLGNSVITTVAGRGYRFTPQVGTADVPPATEPIARRADVDLAHKPSIAVLPFINMSGDTANEYFADGLAEELLNMLSKVRGLHVASRTSAFSFKGEKVDIPAIAQKLNVATILEGSVRKAGNRVRISAQLIHVATDSSLWSAVYDRELQDIFAMQNDIARSVVTELRAALMGEKPDAAAREAVKTEIEVAARGRGENAEAYRLYLQANFHHDRLTPEDFVIAIDAYREALKIEPNYPLAWTGLAIAYAYHTGQGWRGSSVAEGRSVAREAAEKAIQLAPDLAESHNAMGVVRYTNDWDWKGAQACFARALELAPNNVLVLRNAAELLRALGRYDEAIALLRQAIQFDPLSGLAYRYLARTSLAAGRLDEAQAAIRKSLELSPRGAFGHYYHSEISRVQGNLDEALSAAKREIHDSLRLLALTMVYHAQARHAESDAVLEELIATEADSSAFQIAEAFAYRGDRDQAFLWLERAYAGHDAGMNLLRSSPSMRGLHTDARWLPFLDKVGLAG